MTSSRVLPLAAVLACLLGARCGGGPAPAAIPELDPAGMEPQVVEVLERARRRVVDDPRSAEAWGGFAGACDAHALFEAAETSYREARRLDPMDFRWAYLLAVAREAGGAGPDELVELFDTAAGLRPDYAPLHVRLGDALSLRGEFEAARARFDRALELEPDIAVARRGLGQVLLAQGRPGEARAQLERAVQLEPRDLSAHAALAQALMRLGEPGRAETVLGSAAELEPINAMNDPVFEQEVFLRSMSSTRVFGRALMRIRDGDYAGAVVDLEIVLAARPESSASVHYWLGTAYQRDGRAEPAMRHLGQAVAIKPGMVQARVQLAELLARSGDTAGAIEQYREALGRRPDADTHYNLGQAYLQIGRPDLALSQFEAAVSLDPSHPALRRIAELRHRGRDR